VAVPEGVAVADSTAVGDAVVVTQVSDVLSTALSKNDRAEVALLLPIRGNDKADRNFLDFYQGVLVAMDEIKGDGLSIDLRVYNTARDEAKINEIVCQPEFAEADLIIGPVYNDELPSVLRVAEARRVPVISPLSSVKAESPVLFQAAPDAAAKSAKMDSLIAPGSNVVMVTSARDDAEFVAEMKQMLADYRPCGPLTVQLIQDTVTGVNWYIEINPRFGGGAPLSMKAGADSAEALLRLLRGDQVPYCADAAEDGAVYCRFDQSIRVN
jgi:hypothetical protein